MERALFLSVFYTGTGFLAVVGLFFEASNEPPDLKRGYLLEFLAVCDPSEAVLSELLI